MIIRPEAEADMAAAFRWHEEKRPGLGTDFLLCVEAVFDQIARWPESFVQTDRGVRRAVTRRFPFVVYYRIGDNEEVTVLAVLHGRRHQREWKRRT